MKSARTFKSLSITLAAIAMVSSAACTRNQGGKEASPGAPKPAASPAPVAPQVVPSEADGGSSTSSQENAGNADTTNGADGSSSGGVVNYDPTGLTPDQIRAASDAQGPVLVGPKANMIDFSGAELSYSGSGQDSLREIITAHVNSRSEDRKAADAELVGRIKSANVDVDWNTRTMTVSVTLMRGGRAVEFKTRGQLTNQLTMSTVDTRVPGDLAFDATCLDAAGGCKTVHLMVQEDSATGTRTAHVIVRKTKAMWYLEANAQDRNHNPEFNTLLQILWLPSSERKVERVEMDTVEVVGGVSNVLVKLLARKSAYATEWMMWSAPLVKPAASSDMSILMDVVGRGSLNSSMRDTKMIYNDGRGNLRMLVTIRKLQENEREASLTLTIGRIHAPTREVRLSDSTELAEVSSVVTR